MAVVSVEPLTVCVHAKAPWVEAAPAAVTLLGVEDMDHVYDRVVLDGSRPIEMLVPHANDGKPGMLMVRVGGGWQRPSLVRRRGAVQKRHTLQSRVENTWQPVAMQMLLGEALSEVVPAGHEAMHVPFCDTCGLVHVTGLVCDAQHEAEPAVQPAGGVAATGGVSGLPAPHVMSIARAFDEPTQGSSPKKATVLGTLHWRRLRQVR